MRLIKMTVVLAAVAGAAVLPSMAGGNTEPVAFESTIDSDLALLFVNLSLGGNAQVTNVPGAVQLEGDVAVGNP